MVYYFVKITGKKGLITGFADSVLEAKCEISDIFQEFGRVNSTARITEEGSLFSRTICEHINGEWR